MGGREAGDRRDGQGQCLTSRSVYPFLFAPSSATGLVPEAQRALRCVARCFLFFIESSFYVSPGHLRARGHVPREQQWMSPLDLFFPSGGAWRPPSFGSCAEGWRLSLCLSLVFVGYQVGPRENCTRHDERGASMLGQGWPR